MRPFLLILSSTCALLAQGMGAPGAPNYQRYQPSYDELKSVLGLRDDQLAQLKQLQQDKLTATQTFYSKMGDKQKELNGLLEANSNDAAKVGRLMLDLQQLRKQPPPASMDVHEHALGVLDAEQKQKLKRIEDAMKLRAAADQALQLGLINAPPPPAAKPPAGVMHPMGAPAKQ